MLTISPASPVRLQPWHLHPPAVAWNHLLANFADLFTKPSSRLFLSLLTAWPLCPGRRTITRLIAVRS